MKNLFNVIVIVSSFVFCYLFWAYVMGNPDNFIGGDHTMPKPGNVMGVVYTGGFIVSILMAFIVIAFTFTVERFLSIKKAQGKADPEQFIHSIVDTLSKGDLDKALGQCDTQRGTVANIMRSAITRFKSIENDSEYSNDKKISEVQRAIDEQMNLETPLLEKNLVILSTIASVAVLFGLLGTTLGMIRAFQALASSGTVSATQLSLGISEALYNTAGGLIGAILAILAYNFFTNKVDGFVYIIDEGILSVTQIFTGRIKKD